MNRTEIKKRQKRCEKRLSNAESYAEIDGWAEALYAYALLLEAQERLEYEGIG